MCGFVGIIGMENASVHTATALQAIQHRGQDSAGIGSKKGNHFRLFKEIGLVHQIFNKKELDRLEGRCAIGHVRYPTIGSGSKEDSQPFYSRRPGIILAHNGNIMNFEEIKQYLLDQSIYLSSKCDIEPALHVLSNAITTERKPSYTIDDVVKGLKETYKVLKGSFSFVGIISIEGVDTMFVARDPYGIRPAVWSKKGDTYLAASESVCMDVLEHEDLHSVEPGEVIFFQEGKEPVSHIIEQKGRKHCVFEYIYFARPDSHINNHSVYRKRMVLGELLADEWNERNKDVKIDVVIPIPDTSRISAISFSEKLKIPIREGFIKNRYSGRTFIMPDQGARTAALRLKLNPIEAEIKGNNVLLIDDSIVRGNTLKRIATTMKNKHAKSIHLAIYAPPVIHPCYYGIDMSTKEELIANRIKNELGLEGNYVTKENLNLLEERLAEYLGVDSLTFLSVARLRSLFGENICAACFDGDYPVPITDEIKNCIVNDRNDNRE